MKSVSFRELPKIRDSISFVYFEYGRIEQSRLGIEYVNQKGRILIPVANLSTLMLGPGTTVTHAAINTLSKSGCIVIWSGEEGVRFYAHGVGETHKAYKLLRQAELSSDPERRLRVVERMYRARFADRLPEHLTLEQVRGREGVRVRDAYAHASKKYGIAWAGRSYDRGNWYSADPVNRALSTANACLNGICHAAVVSAGYHPALGFIHQGKQLAFVYDIADLYKIAVTVPIAFATAAEMTDNLERTVRRRCRNAFRNLKVVQRVVSDIDKLLDVEKDGPLPDGFDPDGDPARPTPWWDPPEPADEEAL